MTLKFSGTYNVEAAEQVDRSTYQHSITCNVWLLDSTAVAFRVDKRCSGQALLDLTFDYLELLERDFFGLVYTFCEPTGGNLIKWLDPTKRIKKQCKGEANFTFWFRVKFYVPDPAWLQEEYTRYQFFLQVRKDILDGRLPVSRSISVQLAGLALQSELGDYTPEDCPPGYVNQFRFVQNQNADFEVQASEWHRKSSSLLPAAAELEYLNVVRYLDHYGVKSYAVKDGQHDLQTITIGVSFIGISLFRENKMLQQYSWDNIAKINFKGKRFTLHLKTSTKSVNGHLSSISGLTTSPIIKSESELKQHYHFQSAVSTKLFWQYAVSCHAFFRVREPTNVPSNRPITGFTQQQTSSSTISATALYAAMSRVARGFQRYFSVTRRSSLSTATTSGPVGGVGRTLSTLMELRRNSRAFGRSFSRTHSRRSDNLTQVIPTCNPTQIIPPLSKSDASTISPTINPLDCSNTGNQSKSYAQIPPGAKITTSGVIGASSENRLTRLSYRNALNQNRESNILLSSHTSANSSAKIKKLTNSIDIESSANISRLSSQSKQIFNETSSQRNSSNTSFNVLDKSSRSKPHKPASPVSGNNVGATRTSQRRQQQHQDMISTSHSHHTIASNDTKFSSKKFQKSPMNGNYMDYTETDSVDVVHNNQAFDKNETTGYWSTRRMQRLQSSSNNMNNSNPLLNTSLTSVTTSVASATVPMTMSASPLNNPISNIKMHSTSNVNKIDDFQDNDRFSHNRVPITTTFAASTGNAPTTTVTTRRSRYMPTDQCVNTTATYINAASVKDSNVNNDIHSSKLLRSSLSSPINRSSTSTRNQVNYSTKGLDQKTEHLDVIVDCDNDVSSSQYNTHHSKGFLKDPFHPGAPDGESTLHPANEVNELNSEGLVHISIRPDSHGRFGFNVKGGIDHGMPVIVSRVGANMPADLCIPRLSEGDQILFINNKDVSSQTHLQVVNLIRAASEQPHGTLELLVKPSDYVTDDINDDNPIPDSGDAPPIPPRSYQSSLRQPTLSLEKFTRNSKRLKRFSLRSSSHNVVDKELNNGVLLRNSFPSSSLLDSMIELETVLADGSILSQFEHLPRRKSGLTMNVSRLNENSIKNRYRDISPYDQTRVILKEGSGDYINASFVNMEYPKCGVHLRYIAAQGPLPNTYGDFWQMCWEQQVCLIVMLTAISERGRAKCHQYWPDVNQTVNFCVSSSPRISQLRSSTDLQLRTIREEITTHVAYREFDMTQLPSQRTSLQSVLRKQTETRRITQLQYISWPDHGVPNDIDQLISFVEQVQRIRGESSTAPIVVHCSAGIGRTGVLIAIETSINLMERNFPVKPLELVQRMRDHRAMLIQTTGQFQFVCETILKVFHRNHTENSLKDSNSMTSQS